MKKHLASFRKGWQSENLAKYILSNFAFISQPSTIADDLGSDFFCVIFDIIPNGKTKFLVPKESFTIQIKSNRKSYYITGKTEYLKSLGIPFFVGVCNRRSQVLDFYSGEYLIPFFVDEPSAEKIKIKLCETDDCKENQYTEKNSEFTLKFPKLFTISSDHDSPEFKKAIKNLSKTCRAISRNITRRNNKEYIFFESFSNNIILVSNKKLIKESIDARLNKIFFELAYIIENDYIDVDLNKYEKIMDSLRKL
ncbi:MAG: hypothetical protein HZA77_16060 [Candidatus Schekmanbacteria bacterium]|nr:hypothetical protein [Candidatus Schekmanbacteria bacterium]